jgi:hypothetical protein
MVWAKNRRQVKFLERDIMETILLKNVDPLHWRETFPEYREEHLLGISLQGGRTSGGLFDGEGRLVGLTTIYLEGRQNLNFAMPVEWIIEI